MEYMYSTCIPLLHVEYVQSMAEVSDTRIQRCIQVGSGYNRIQWPDTILIYKFNLVYIIYNKSHYI